VSHSEQTLRFACQGESLLGIVSLPAVPKDTGVVIIVGGPQYRAGSHRQFVLLARVLADAGYTALRFDVRGMGDSTGGQRNFEQIAPDVGAAIDALLRHAPTLQRVVLLGLCDGASAALLYLHQHQDPRVGGLCLLNPWVRSETSLARTHVKHYYLQRLGQREFWAKLVRGQVGGTALRGLADNVRQASGAAAGEPSTSHFADRMAVALSRFDGPVQLVLSEHDYTAKEFSERAATDEAWRHLLDRSTVDVLEFDGADHTFSSMSSRKRLAETCDAWLSRRQSGVAPGRMRAATAATTLCP
jgi:exosortase A-associated hydrolase 1